MPHTIALLTTWLDNWYQAELYRGAVRAAKESGSRLLCLVGHTTPSMHLSLDSTSVYGLAGRSQTEGLLLSAASLSFWKGPQALAGQLEWLNSKPMVSLGLRMEGLDSTFPEGSGIEEMVHHFVNTHDCHHIAFISGPANNPDAQRRLLDYQTGLAKAGIAFDPQKVECGNFFLEGGKEAMRKLLARGPLDAVIAANDSMAIGAAQALKEAGKRIPREIHLSGFDGSPEGRFLQPALTTVENPASEVAALGVEQCLARLSDPERPAQHQSVATQVLYRKSCGCLRSFGGDTFKIHSEEQEVLEMLVSQLLADSEQRHMQFLFWLQDQLASDDPYALEHSTRWVYLVGQQLQRLGNSERVSRAIEFLAIAQEILFEAQQSHIGSELSSSREQVRRLHRMESALLASTHTDELLAALQEHLSQWCPSGIRLFLHHRDFAPAAPQDLRTAPLPCRIHIGPDGIRPLPECEDLLPEQAEPGETWIAVPIEQGDMRFGVLLFRNWNEDLAFIEHLRMAVSTAFAVSWRTRCEAELRDSLRKLSLRDELTGLYNRRGLSEISPMLVNRAKRENKRLAVLLMDLDGLKQINDHYGHADGDLAIATFGQALLAGFRETDLVARYGGDEFAALLTLDQDSELSPLLERFQNLLEERSARLERPWTLRTSLGYSLWDPSQGSDLDSHMSKADQALYEDKGRRKQMRHP